MKITKEFPLAEAKRKRLYTLLSALGFEETIVKESHRAFIKKKNIILLPLNRISGTNMIDVRNQLENMGIMKPIVFHDTMQIEEARGDFYWKKDNNK